MGQEVISHNEVNKMQDILQIMIQVMLGIALAAVCGYRIFVPLLAMGIAGMAGYMQFSEGFAWISSWPAVLVFGIATILELAAYFIPHIDNILHAIALPAGAVAGVIVAASVISDVDPMLKWSLAIIAGGGAATLTGLLSNGVHHLSTAVSAGFANPVVSAAESAGTVAASALSIAMPVAGAAVLVLVITVSVVIFLRIRKKRKKATVE